MLDGFGWLQEKKNWLLSTFPQLTEEHILWEMDGAKGWADYYWAVVRHHQTHGTGVEFKSKNYIQQEKELMRHEQNKRRTKT